MLWVIFLSVFIVCIYVMLLLCPLPCPTMPSSSIVLTLAKSAEQIEVSGEICLYIP